MIFRGRLIINAHSLSFVQISEKASQCFVAFPQNDFKLILSGEEEDYTATLKEGSLFQSFYELSLNKKISFDGTARFETTLSIQKGLDSEIINMNDSDNTKCSWEAPEPFKTAWGPSPHPLRCPDCLHSEREVHLLEENGVYRCQFCSFHGSLYEIEEAYRRLVPKSSKNT